jgi:Thioredoxin domain
MNTLCVEIIGRENEICHFLQSNVLTAIAKLSIAAQVKCITDNDEIKRRGLDCTPALIINGRVVGQGQNISSRKIQTLLWQATPNLHQGDFFSRGF